MNRLAFLAATLVLVAALIGVQHLTRVDPDQRNFEIFTEMAYSHAAESFSPNAHFADRKTLQPLVAGVVPRGTTPFPYGDGPDEARRAGEDLSDPLPEADDATAARGAELYRIYCALCHDARGEGRGPIVQHGMLPPPSLHAARALQMADGEMFHVLTRGQGNMAAYAAQLDPTERWMVVRHIRRLQREDQ